MEDYEKFLFSARINTTPRFYCRAEDVARLTIEGLRAEVDCDSAEKKREKKAEVTKRS